MATYMRSAFSFLSAERVLLSKQGIAVLPKRGVRALRRTPVKVIYPEDEVAKRAKPPPVEVMEPAGRRSGREPPVSGADPARTKNSDPLFLPAGRKHEVDGLRFEKAFPGDKRLARVVSVARSRTFREHQGKILLEGKRLICDALAAGAKPQMVFFSTVERLRELPLHKLRAATLVKVKFEEIKIWSEVVAPQGVIAIFSRPDPSQLSFTDMGHSVPLSLVCDNIRDPGNLGTMLRCAAAAGCHNALLTKGCVDAWEPKVLRSAMGAHFRLPIYPNLSWTEVENYLPEQTTVHLADNHRETVDHQLITSHKPTKAGDYGWTSTKQNHKKAQYDDDFHSDSDSDDENQGLCVTSLDSKLYHDTWAQGPTAIVIGGETWGLSAEAVELAESSAGHRLFIPIVPSMDSLNSAMAASILLFEGRKQLLKQTQTSGRKVRSKR
ncbi:rRNA methyltransferase 3A, mitochondrial [Synchiropus splendidus]|uniref:rRNA methyltransferase 3A, mitochondrial n=1 Tax=Synchiropus splendidus TaxID=270530 RepID=UPI00237E5779|nr:rRNA methyltransferase 3A, mitochondrial [Synchiropus splendidus]